jgi:hypothetical protein
MGAGKLNSMLPLRFRCFTLTCTRYAAINALGFHNNVGVAKMPHLRTPEAIRRAGLCPILKKRDAVRRHMSPT